MKYVYEYHKENQTFTLTDGIWNTVTIRQTHSSKYQVSGQVGNHREGGWTDNFSLQDVVDGKMDHYLKYIEDSKSFIETLKQLSQNLINDKNFPNRVN